MRIILFLSFMLFVNLIVAQTRTSKDTVKTNDSTKVDLKDSTHANLHDTIGWHIETIFDLKFSQISLHNWAAGGQSSIALNTALSFSADYRNDKITWTNTIDMDYGFFNQAKSPHLAKTDDRFDLNSLFGRKAWRHWEYESFFSFKSQFSKSYSNPLDFDSLKNTIADFMAPAFIGFGVGMDYKPNEHFNLLIAPFSAKITVVNNQKLADAGAFGVVNEKDTAGVGIAGSGQKIRKEFGGTFKVMYKAHISEKFDLHARLDLFSNYMLNPQNIDVNFEVIANWRVTKFLSFSINVLLIYDHDVNITRNTTEIDPSTGLYKTKTGPITQFREIFGFGLNYVFDIK